MTVNSTLLVSSEDIKEALCGGENIENTRYTLLKKYVREKGWQNLKITVFSKLNAF